MGFLCALLGFFALALAMGRHHRQIRQRNPSIAIRWALRVSGAAGLCLSLLASAAHFGWAIGAVLWFGWLTLTALLVSLFFSFSGGAEGL